MLMSGSENDIGRNHQLLTQVAKANGALAVMTVKIKYANRMKGSSIIWRHFGRSTDLDRPLKSCRALLT